MWVRGSTQSGPYLVSSIKRALFSLKRALQSCKNFYIISSATCVFSKSKSSVNRAPYSVKKALILLNMFIARKTTPPGPSTEPTGCVSTNRLSVRVEFQWVSQVYGATKSILVTHSVCVYERGHISESIDTYKFLYKYYWTRVECAYIYHDKLYIARR